MKTEETMELVITRQDQLLIDALSNRLLCYVIAEGKLIDKETAMREYSSLVERSIEQLITRGEALVVSILEFTSNPSAESGDSDG